MFWCKHANIRKQVSERSWLSGWVIFSILAHLAHLAHSHFSLIFNAINTYDCFCFDQTEKNKVTQNKVAFAVSLKEIPFTKERLSLWQALVSKPFKKSVTFNQQRFVFLKDFLSHPPIAFKDAYLQLYCLQHLYSWQGNSLNLLS